ncbi:MAG: hypothetical protein IKR13_02360 [Victivallales bacterium]|nr:hypothetical protein [Victivallales bacterium]
MTLKSFLLALLALPMMLATDSISFHQNFQDHAVHAELRHANLRPSSLS